MSYRQVIISEDVIKIGIEHSNIKITKVDNEKIIIPVEDVFIILIETQKTLLSTQFLVKCAEYKICVVVCNSSHDPFAICMGYNTHYRSLQILNLQIELDESVKSILWKQIIECKIRNQKAVVQWTSNIQEDITMLADYSGTVEMADISNREGIAAKVFFKSLYGSEFIRFYDDAINKALNFGYKIITSAIVRELVSLGMDPKIGLWHDSKTNPVNLACDLVEPYRPVVDYFIYEHVDQLIDELPIRVRRSLVGILNTRVNVCGKMQTLQNCIGYTVKSFLQVLEGRSVSLQFPSIGKIEF